MYKPSHLKLHQFETQIAGNSNDIAEQEKDMLGAMHPKWMAYQNIVASVEKSIYDLSIAILFAMTVTNVLQSQLLKILNNVKDIFYFFPSNIHVWK